MRLVTSTLISVMALATLFSASASAENFLGILDDKGRPVPVTLNLRADAAPGARAGTLRFGGPWACGFDVELTQVTDRLRTYFLRGAGAGRCTVLTAGYLHSQPSEEGLAIALSDASNRLPALYSVMVKPTGS